MRRPADLLAAAEAVIMLTVAYAGVRALPFRTVARLCRLREGAGALGASGATADRVEWAVAAVGRRLPFETTCLMRATAGAVMLRHRRLASEVTLGVARLPESAGFSAHAWLTCGDRILTGAKERPLFTAVATYHAG